MYPYTHKLRLCGIMIFPIFLAGCAAIGKLPTPENHVPEKWSGNVAATLSEKVSAPSPGELFRKDPLLADLIDTACKQNSDLKIAEARVREARALRSVAASDSLPHIALDGAEQRSRSSEATTPAMGLSSGGATHQELYDAGFDATWEIDLFGRVRRQVRGAAARAEAESAARDMLQITLTAEVARNYYELRGAQAQQAILEALCQSQKKALELVTRRVDAGTARGLEATLSRGQVESTEARLPAVAQQVQRTTTALAVLLAEPPDTIRERLGQSDAVPETAIDPGADFPAEVLRRRPDIRQAEKQLESAAAAVGVATADLFPRITLLGSGGVRGADMNDLGRIANRYWTFGPSVQWPILDTGRVLGNIRAQRARHEQALHQYEKAVLTALKEVEDSLITRHEEENRRQRLANAAHEYEEARKLAEKQYTSGIKDYLYVLESDRSLLEARLAQCAGDTALAVSTVSLYKALGGGWRAPAGAPADTTK